MRRAIYYICVFILTALILPSTRPLAQSGKGVGVREQVTALPAKNKRWALVIGVDEYVPGSNISRLDGAVNDARALAHALVEYAGFPEEQVVMLATNEKEALQPTRRNVLKYLSNWRNLAHQDGLLLVAFSGHGVERGGKAFLLPSDAIASNDVALLEDTAISVENLKRRIKETGVKQVLLILDACRNEPTAARSDGDNRMTAAFSRSFDFDQQNSGVEAFATLQAASIGQRAYEFAAKRQGYFTYVLIEGIKGGAANEHGTVTLAGLVRYLEKEVPRYVKRDLGSNSVQVPYTSIGGYRASELVLSVPPKAPPKPPEPAPPVADRCAIAWDSIRTTESEQTIESFLAGCKDSPQAFAANLRLGDLRARGRPDPPANSVPAALTPVISLPRGVPAGALRGAPITTATVDANGRVTRQQAGPIQFYQEDLGGGVKLEMVAVPGGRFQMGSPSSESGRDDDETQHWVRVSDFWIGRYEVTQGQWKAVMGSLPPNMASLGSEFKGDDLPVVNVSWEEAQEFIKRLNARLNNANYRLPREAEWEFASRAGKTTPFGFGATITPELENYWWDNPYGNAPKKTRLGYPVKVGSYVPNPLGLFDMHGNVWEWCEDWYGSYLSAEATDPTGPSNGSARVHRGGGWYYSAVYCRSASRNRLTPGYRGISLGFRLLRTYR